MSSVHIFAYPTTSPNQDESYLSGFKNLLAAGLSAAAGEGAPVTVRIGVAWLTGSNSQVLSDGVNVQFLHTTNGLQIKFGTYAYLVEGAVDAFLSAATIEVISTAIFATLGIVFAIDAPVLAVVAAEAGLGFLWDRYLSPVTASEIAALKGDYTLTLYNTQNQKVIGGDYSDDAPESLIKAAMAAVQFAIDHGQESQLANATIKANEHLTSGVNITVSASAASGASSIFDDISRRLHVSLSDFLSMDTTSNLYRSTLNAPNYHRNSDYYVVGKTGVAYVLSPDIDPNTTELLAVPVTIGGKVQTIDVASVYVQNSSDPSAAATHVWGNSSDNHLDTRLLFGKIGGGQIQADGHTTLVVGSDYADTISVNDSLLTYSDDTLVGGLGDDRISGGRGDDVIDGGGGADTLYGGAHSDTDTLIGGTGKDTYIVNTGDGARIVIFDDGGNLTIDGAVVGSAFATAKIGALESGVAVSDPATRTWSLGQYTLSWLGLDLTLISGNERVILKNFYDGEYGIFLGLPQVTSPIISGNDTANAISGASVPAVINGFDGDDTIRAGNAGGIIAGGLGGDILYGGPGVDVFKYNSASESKVNPHITNGGIDTIIGFTPTIDKIDISGLNLLGLSTKNGPGWSDGGVHLIDIYQFSDSNGIYSTLSVNSDGNYGAVLTVSVQAAITAADIVSTPLGTSQLGVEMYANSGGLTLIGGSGTDGLTIGGQFSDVLYGRAGNDILSDNSYGGSATMYGGPGDDVYYVSNTQSVVSEATEPGIDDGGRDVVSAYVDFTLGDFIEDLTLNGKGITGNGNSLDNFMIARGPYDSLYGGGGDDIFEADYQTFIDGGAGSNTLYVFQNTDSITVWTDGKGYIHFDGSFHGSGAPSATLVNIQYINLQGALYSTSYIPAIVNGYENLLGRAPSGSETFYWINSFAKGTTVAAFNKVLANDATGKANEPALVKYLYDGYFGRDPSSSETTYWSGALQSGAASLASLNTTLANDGAGKANAYLSIKGLYDVYLGRDPGVSEVSYWSGALKAGTYDLRGFELVLAAQAGASANAAAYVTQAYKTWLGHAPSTSDLSYWTGQFNDGALTPLQLRQALINDASGQAYISSVITADYTADFGRAATSAEITTWKGLIANGAGFVTLTSALLGDGGGATARTITATYDSYFGRDPTNSEMAVWRGMLTSGTTQASMRATLVNDASGQAHTVSEVGTLYQEYFGRAATTSEVNVWKGLVANGSTFVQLHDALVGDASGKAYAAAEISPLYQAIEGRAASTAEVNYWTGVFNSGASNLDTFVDTLLRDGGSKIVPMTVASGHAATTFVDVLDTLVINGFAAGDQVNFHGAVFDSYNPLDHAVQVNGDVLIYGTDATHFVLLENIQLANLTAANFIHV